MLTASSGVNADRVKRRKHWPHQAAWLLAPPSGVVTGPAKRRKHWSRQAV